MSIVYILTNQAMPGLIKVGQTADLLLRMRQLYNSGVPLPFECFYAARVTDPDKVETNLHIAFSPHRVNENREFFRLDPTHAAAALELTAIEDVTPNRPPVETQQDEAALEKASKRAERFNFEMVNIPTGAILHFIQNNDITCEVSGRSRVRFEGEEVSLSVAALKALRKVGKNWKSAQGAQFWLYEGESLIELREKMEADE